MDLDQALLLCRRHLVGHLWRSHRLSSLPPSDPSLPGNALLHLFTGFIFVLVRNPGPKLLGYRHTSVFSPSVSATRTGRLDQHVVAGQTQQHVSRRCGAISTSPAAGLQANALGPIFTAGLHTNRQTCVNTQGKLSFDCGFLHKMWSCHSGFLSSWRISHFYQVKKH